MKREREKIRAEKNIKILFAKAGKNSNKNPALARDYLRKARRLAMHFNIKLSRETRKKFCSKCLSFFTPQNSQVRVRKGFIVIHCLNCKNLSRYKV